MKDVAMSVRGKGRKRDTSARNSMGFLFLAVPRQSFANGLPCVPSWPCVVATRKRLPSAQCSHPH